MLENSVKEKKNLQSREGERHVNVGTNSQDYEIQGSNLDQSTQTSIVEIASFSVDQLYQEKYSKYLRYHWIQGLEISRITRSLSRYDSRRFFGILINQSLKYTPMACTSTTNVNIIWDDFANFHAIIFF
jgi:hypothetical protein